MPRRSPPGGMRNPTGRRVELRPNVRRGLTVDPRPDGLVDDSGSDPDTPMDTPHLIGFGALASSVEAASQADQVFAIAMQGRSRDEVEAMHDLATSIVSTTGVEYARALDGIRQAMDACGDRVQGFSRAVEQALPELRGLGIALSTAVEAGDTVDISLSGGGVRFMSLEPDETYEVRFLGTDDGIRSAWVETDEDEEEEDDAVPMSTPANGTITCIPGESLTVWQEGSSQRTWDRASPLVNGVYTNDMPATATATTGVVAFTDLSSEDTLAYIRQVPDDLVRTDWCRQHANVVLWLCTPENRGDNRFLNSVYEWLLAHGSLTDRQVTAVLRNVTGERAPRYARQGARPGAALAEQVEWLPNGTYTIDDGGNHLVYKIYTVTRGNLAGKRIIKIQHRNGEFNGFASLNISGGMNLWSRFEADADDTYVVWCHKLLQALKTIHDAGGNLRQEVASYTLPADGDRTWTVSVSRECLRCNRPLTDPTSIARGLGNECARQDTNRTTRARTNRTGVSFEAEPRQAAAPRTRGQLVMSELGTEWEQ